MNAEVRCAVVLDTDVLLAIATHADNYKLVCDSSRASVMVQQFIPVLARPLNASGPPICYLDG